MASSAPRKKRAGRLASAGVITEAAAALFLSKGYLATSMDEIAAQAGVSKQTIYKHFADKERLFTGLIASTTARAAQFIETITPLLQSTENLEKDLHEIASRYVSTVFSPQVLQLRKLVVMESARFPEIARNYYEQAPGRTVAALAAAFHRLSERGLLRVDDPRIAAMHFAGLIVMMPLDKTMFGGTFTPEELQGFADAGVRAFLAAYGPTHSGGALTGRQSHTHREQRAAAAEAATVEGADPRSPWPRDARVERR
jgi:TetR/AcrR family transcriptional repressor of mexJK operon